MTWDFFYGKKKEENKRPPNAETCPSCGGSGVMDEESFNLMRCNECLGQGWIIPFNLEDEEQESDLDHIMNTLVHDDE